MQEEGMEGRKGEGEELEDKREEGRRCRREGRERV